MPKGLAITTVSRDRREALQELGQGLPCLEVIEQRREGYASADEYGRAHDLRVAVNDRVAVLHQDSLPLANLI
jgi:hypothetical protein